METTFPPLSPDPRCWLDMRSRTAHIRNPHEKFGPEQSRPIRQKGPRPSVSTESQILAVEVYTYVTLRHTFRAEQST